ncbi:MAG: site-specific integrase [Candidatus Nanopelagicales bacterium]
MRGSIVTRKDAKGRDRYFVVIEERTHDGKRRRRWHSDPATGSGFTSKRAAENHAATLVTSVASGSYVEPTRETVGDWLDTWLALVKPSLRPSTWASYDKNIRLHVRPALGTVELRRLTAVDLDRLYAHLLEQGRTDGSGGLSVRTVRYVATIVKRSLKDAVRKGLIPRNPADAADPPKPSGATHGDVQAWGARDLATFLAATQEHVYGPVWAFLAATGCRRGEALGLRWSDLHLGTDKRTRASFIQTVQKIKGEVVIGSTKTASSRRVVVLDDATVAMLKRVRVAQDGDRLKVGPGWPESGLVFTHGDGRGLHPETISRAFRESVDKLGLPPIPLHGLRHTWATLALQAGVHPKVVQERLGHANVSITLNIYSHVAPTMHGDAADTVAALVASAGKR